MARIMGTMTKPHLSICIPTYNFGRFLGQTLESVIPNLTEGVEVVILDGGSTDDTANVVAQKQRGSPQIQYHRQEFRGGIDRDIAKVISLAHGDYCWLFSSDDAMRPGAIAKVLSQIKHGHDIYLCKHTRCTADLKYISEYPVLRADKEAEFNLTSPSERQRYFELAITSEAFFSFMGGIIIKKSKWDSVPINEAFVGSCWGHVARIFELIPRGLMVKYLAEPLLDRRGGTDSFADKGVVNRYRIGIDGYHKLGEVFFGYNSCEAYHIRRVIRYEYTLYHFLEAKLSCWKKPSSENWNVLHALFRKAYDDFSLLSRLKYLAFMLLPGWLLYVLKHTYARIKGYCKKLLCQSQ